MQFLFLVSSDHLAQSGINLKMLLVSTYAALKLHFCNMKSLIKTKTLDFGLMVYCIVIVWSDIEV